MPPAYIQDLNALHDTFKEKQNRPSSEELERVKNINNYEAHNRAIREMRLIQHRDSMEGLVQTMLLRQAMIKWGKNACHKKIIYRWSPDGAGHYNNLYMIVIFQMKWRRIQ